MLEVAAKVGQFLQIRQAGQLVAAALVGDETGEVPLGFAVRLRVCVIKRVVALMKKTNYFKLLTSQLT